jgi:hypothetical protein
MTKDGPCKVDIHLLKKFPTFIEPEVWLSCSQKLSLVPVICHFSPARNFTLCLCNMERFFKCIFHLYPQFMLSVRNLLQILVWEHWHILYACCDSSLRNPPLAGNSRAFLIDYNGISYGPYYDELLSDARAVVTSRMYKTCDKRVACKYSSSTHMSAVTARGWFLRIFFEPVEQNNSDFLSPFVMLWPPTSKYVQARGNVTIFGTHITAEYLTCPVFLVRKNIDWGFEVGVRWRAVVNMVMNLRVL